VIPVRFRERLPRANIHRSAPAELADEGIARLAAERQGSDAAGAGFAETIEAHLLQHHPRHRSGCDLAQFEIAPTTQCERNRLPVGVGVILVSEGAEWYLARNVVL